MKTLLSISIAGWLSLGLFGCGGDDETLEDASPEAAPDATTTSPPPADDAASTVVSDGTGDPEPEPVVDGPSEGVSDPGEAQPTPALVAPAPLEWRACGQFQNRNLQCAEVEVPIDYADPEGETIDIAVRRIVADPSEPYHGSLLFNPGGPGGGGIDTALTFIKNGLFDIIAPGYDIIGFDPRGVAASGERGCGNFAEEQYPGATAAPREATAEDFVLSVKAFGDACEREWGTLFRKLGSNNVVRDMEEIRKALNEPRLNFYGASYGTLLGALYAHAYPQTTGRVVLDAPVDPRSNVVEMTRDTFHQAIALHEAIFTGCESGELVCPPDARQVFEQILVDADARGVRDDFVGTWQANLASPPGRDELLAVLAAEVADPGGDWIEAFAGGDGSGGQGLVALIGVDCTDSTIEPPTIEQLELLAEEFEQESPLFARVVQSAALCTGWPTTRDPVPLPTAIDAPAALVIGGLSDARTPYPWARTMTETLGNATLLTSAHYGHGAIAWGSDCTLLTIRAYLASGSMPATGALCQ
jgi:pimeloyl-ACP methyl ester carboxylesterase